MVALIVLSWREGEGLNSNIELLKSAGSDLWVSFPWKFILTLSLRNRRGKREIYQAQRGKSQASWRINLQGSWREGRRTARLESPRRSSKRRGASLWLVNCLTQTRGDVVLKSFVHEIEWKALNPFSPLKSSLTTCVEGRRDQLVDFFRSRVQSRMNNLTATTVLELEHLKTTINECLGLNWWLISPSTRDTIFSVLDATVNCAWIHF